MRHHYFRVCVPDESYPDTDTNTIKDLLGEQPEEGAFIGLFNTFGTLSMRFDFDGYPIYESTCPECNGSGELEVLWDQGFHPELSAEQAEALAGTAEYTTPCPRCKGTGECLQRSGEGRFG